MQKIAGMQLFGLLPRLSVSSRSRTPRIRKHGNPSVRRINRRLTEIDEKYESRFIDSLGNIVIEKYDHIKQWNGIHIIRK